MAREKLTYFIYHYCLNENLPKEHPDYCCTAWVDECTSTALSQQNWKYCEKCESKGFPKHTLKDRLKGEAIRLKMVAELEKHKQENMSPEKRARVEKMMETKNKNKTNSVMVE